MTLCPLAQELIATPMAVATAALPAESALASMTVEPVLLYTGLPIVIVPPAVNTCTTPALDGRTEPAVGVVSAAIGFRYKRCFD